MAEQVDIVADGDVILVTRSEGSERSQPQETRIRVSSHMMSAVSPVFSKMFAANVFLEGQDLSSKAPKVVALPSDSPEAMKMICYIAHHKLRSLAVQVDPHQLLDFAIHVDRYQCQEAIQAQAECWLKYVVNASNAKGMETLLEICFFLGNKRLFYHVSKRLARQHPQDGELNPNTDSRLLYALSTIRTLTGRARHHMISGIEDMVFAHLPYSRPGHAPSYQSQPTFLAAGRLLHHLIQHNAWPTSSLPSGLEDCARVLADIPDLVLRVGGAQGAPSAIDLSCLRERGTSALTVCDGLCLDCVRLGEIQGDGSCHAGHT